MSFNTMNKTKRNQIIVVVVATLLVLGGLGFGLIKYQYEYLEVLARQKDEAVGKLQLMETAVKNADEIEATLGEISQSLAEKESTLASGDL